MNGLNNSKVNKKKKVLITGIGGASLGTELLKCLQLAGGYEIYGCDIVNLAYGHYMHGFEKTFLISKDNYVHEIISICKREGIKYIVPGAEEPMVLLSKYQCLLEQNELILIGNTPKIIKVFSNKDETFKLLKSLNFSVPQTIKYSSAVDLSCMPFPAVVKPSSGSGGSSFVFFVQNKEEAEIYADYLLRNSKDPIVQEYLPIDETVGGEFSACVLNLPNGNLVGAIALKREYPSKLSVSARFKNGIISSPYTQGLIDKFPQVERVAIDIATAINSKGPINVQGRMRKGIFTPFEINPRFSGSAYFRAMAGFNEVDVLIKTVDTGYCDPPSDIQYGYYLRSLSEIFVKREQIKNDKLD